MERAPAFTQAPIDRDIARLTARVEDLERRLRVEPERMTSPPPFVFSYPGTIGTYVFGKHFYPRTTVAELLRVDLVTAGTTDTVIELNRNGTVFATLTIPAGLDSALLAIGQVFRGRFDYAQAAITAAGAGATELSIHMFTIL